MPEALRQSYAYCQALARREARNFYYSFLTLPRDRFLAMCALYAFMRVTDDLSDSTASLQVRGAALDAWQAELHSALNGEATGHPALPALADAVGRYSVPSRHLEEVITGVRMDLQCPRYQSFEDLARYCYHVAGAVGLACIHIWGFRDDRAIAAAIDCGLAFQLTNILRDVQEDAQRGRLYLPLEDLGRFGLAPEEVSRGAADPRVRQLLAFEAGRAREYYAKARLLIDYLEPCGRPVLETMLAIYGGLLEEMERRGFDVFSRRVELSRARKWSLVLRTAARAGCRRLWGNR